MAQPFVNLSDSLQKQIVNALTPFYNAQEINGLMRALDLFATGNLGAQITRINNLNSWATALATKLNADAGVTDTNYDTTPQS